MALLHTQLWLDQKTQLYHINPEKCLAGVWQDIGKEVWWTDSKPTLKDVWTNIRGIRYFPVYEVSTICNVVTILWGVSSGSSGRTRPPMRSYERTEQSYFLGKMVQNGPYLPHSQIPLNTYMQRHLEIISRITYLPTIPNSPKPKHSNNIATMLPLHP